MKLKNYSTESCATANMSNPNINGHTSANFRNSRKQTKNIESDNKSENSCSSDHVDVDGSRVDNKVAIVDNKSFNNSSLNHSESSSLCSGSVGGRLKFFKDGKFILELSHKKEGDRTCWIPVTKKTCWTPVQPSPRPASLTSLSASDDNSSLHSFPFQREHRWKQPSPRYNINKDLEFTLFHTSSNLNMPKSNNFAYLIRRKPFNTSIFDTFTNRLKSVSRPNGRREQLSSIIQILWERIISNKSEPDIVSPRKRILKEFEKVSLEESFKRQKGVNTGRVISTYSIATILEENDDSVLRTLLRSPSTSPDSVISHSSSITPNYHARDVITPLPSVHFPHNNMNFPPYRVGQHGFWPLPYPLSNSLVSLPVYPIPHYLASAHQQPQHIVNHESLPDTPLNLSKHSG